MKNRIFNGFMKSKFILILGVMALGGCLSQNDTSKTVVEEKKVAPTKQEMAKLQEYETNFIRKGNKRHTVLNLTGLINTPYSYSAVTDGTYIPVITNNILTFPKLSNNELSFLEIYFNTTELSEFFLVKKVSSEPNYDFLNVYIIDNPTGVWTGQEPLAASWSGEDAGFTQINPILINPGSHKIRIEYKKDGSVSSNDDTAWIQSISILKKNIENIGDIKDAISTPFPYTLSKSYIPNAGVNTTKEPSILKPSNDIRFGYIDSNSSSKFQINVNTSSYSTLKFDKKTSSELGYDFLIVSVDNIQIAKLSGIQDWSSTSYPLYSGQHTIAFEYIKDGSVVAGEDTAYVRNIRITP